MKSKIIKIVLCLFVVVSLSSCYSYKPGYINSPRFEEKGEVNIGGSVGNNLGANVSYNPIDKLAILGELSSGINMDGNIEGDNYYYYNQHGNEVTNFDYRDMFYGLAAGTYLKYNETFYQDFYVGYGRGYGSAYAEFNLLTFPFDNFDLVAFEGTYNNIFLQSSLKIKVSRIVDLSLNARLNFLHFESFNYVFDGVNSHTANKESINEINNFFSDRNRIPGQIGLTATFRLENFNLFAQFQVGIEDGSGKDYFSVRPFSTYFGFSLPLHHFWK